MSSQHKVLKKIEEISTEGRLVVVDTTLKINPRFLQIDCDEAETTYELNHCDSKIVFSDLETIIFSENKAGRKTCIVVFGDRSPRIDWMNSLHRMYQRVILLPLGE